MVQIRKNNKFKEALKTQEKIGKLINKLDNLGFEFMFSNMQSSIRRKRK
tara:strand:- start:233 stop:379 length:147 start_codon:yes stop_codon:yes gene_type:complete